MSDFEDKDVLWLVVDEWDLDSDGELVSEDEAGVRHGQRFGFSAENIAYLLFGKDSDPERGREGGYDDTVRSAVEELLEGVEGDSILDGMLDAVSDETGWCIIASHVEGTEE